MAEQRRGLSPAALERVRAVCAPDGRVVRVRPLRGGVSSSVHLVHLEASKGKREAVIVRRYGAYAQEHEPDAARREFDLLDHLSKLDQPVPRPLLVEESAASAFQAQTVVMTRVAGRPLLAPHDLHEYLRQMAAALMRLHGVPVENLEFVPDQRRFVDRALRDELTPPADDALQTRMWGVARRLWQSLRGKQSRWQLVHGDYWPGNLLWRRGRLMGIVDWEQPRLGDPTKDVATCRGDLSILFGQSAADEFTSLYVELGGSVTDLEFWDLLVATWAVREMPDWAVAYPLLGRADMTPEVAVERIRAFAQVALDASEMAGHHTRP